ncbi:universal stress protein [Sphingomonas arantia]|uniref:Universal stress protein n=1 Tax=Sphingomonas arantia TaxID=1460676 RepID=A0ABW4TTS5_9SPHN
MKSILLHIYDDTGLESRMQAAFDLARAFGGHITCLHATPYEDYLATDPLLAAALPAEFSAKMEMLRIALQARVEARMQSEGVTWEWRHIDDAMARGLIAGSALADVIVLSLAGPAATWDDPRPLAAAVATGAMAAVLAIPTDARRFDASGPALVAWNGSAEAALAVKAALPLLRIASSVHLIEVEDRAQAYPRDHAARYLSDHGIAVEIIQRGPIDGSVSRALIDSATGIGVGLIVMGAFGRSRLRELLLGGVTRDLLHSSPVPLLLAH